MSRSSARRGLIEPLPALAAVLAIGLALGLYADAMTAVEPEQSEDGAARATVQSVHDDVSRDGAALPRRLPDAGAVEPVGYDVNLTLSVGPREWSTGPVPPDGAADASRRTPVRTDRWTVRPGRLTVVVWT